MNAIILAAGTGARLDPLFPTTPKSLIRLSEQETIMERTIRILQEFKMSVITLVTGYEHKQFDYFQSMGVSRVYCPFYRITNNIVSLWMARSYMANECLILYADIVYHPEIIERAMNFRGHAGVVVDRSVTSGADYGVAIEGDHVIAMSKQLQEYQAEYVGITRLSPQGGRALSTQIDKMLEAGLTNAWYEDALVDMIYTEPNYKLEYIDIAGREWVEIDSVNDLAKAKRIFGIPRILNPKINGRPITWHD